MTNGFYFLSIFKMKIIGNLCWKGIPKKSSLFLFSEDQKQLLLLLRCFMMPLTCWEKICTSFFMKSYISSVNPTS